MCIHFFQHFLLIKVKLFHPQSRNSMLHFFYKLKNAPRRNSHLRMSSSSSSSQFFLCVVSVCQESSAPPLLGGGYSLQKSG
ncbi:hypothetical protein VIGAN_07147000 [Vigna angularis var. angularis]|uniref:Uncharacterized protein n=1 Tax=Vigna angularis var. angularis TaxID=157739 RepID=A0A0S3SIN0_PHAAN|nr:hypothetical protein VIGAN_07147000 [Vigna angularis var. angularis]